MQPFTKDDVSNYAEAVKSYTTRQAKGTWCLVPVMQAIIIGLKQTFAKKTTCFGRDAVSKKCLHQYVNKNVLIIWLFSDLCAITIRHLEHHMYIGMSLPWMTSYKKRLQLHIPNLRSVPFIC